MSDHAPPKKTEESKPAAAEVPPAEETGATPVVAARPQWKEILGAIKQAVRDIFQSLKGGSEGSLGGRRIGWLFVVGVVGVVVTLATKIFYKGEGARSTASAPTPEAGAHGKEAAADAHGAKKADDHGDGHGAPDPHGKPADTKKAGPQVSPTLLELGVFSAELTLSEGEKPFTGGMNLLQIEMFVECDKAETCKFLKDRSVDVKDFVSAYLNGVKRSEALTFNAKQRMKEQLQEKMNSFLSELQFEGKVKAIFFNRYMIN